MCLHVNEWGTSNWLLTNNNTSSLGKALINWSNTVIWGLDLDQEDWLLELWFGSKLTSIENSSTSWDDLTTTSVDSIGMKGNIMNVESATSHVLITHSSFLSSPLESGFHGILDFVQELDTLSGINKNVWTGGVWTETPDLLGISLVPLELVNKDL